MRLNCYLNSQTAQPPSISTAPTTTTNIGFDKQQTENKPANNLFS